MTKNADSFEQHRPALTGLAYRMLGSLSDAEDVVQDAAIRFVNADSDDIENQKAWLMTVTSRLAIDLMRKRKAQREDYVGPWLPDPVETEAGHLPGEDLMFSAASGPEADPEAILDRAEGVSNALLLMLERLAATERAAFLLHDVFDFSYNEIAPIVGKSESTCRQLVSRARKRVKETKPRFEAPAESHQLLAARFIAATQSGDLDELVACLTPDAELISDGGAKARAARRPLTGAEEVAQVMIAVSQKTKAENLDVKITELNGALGLVLYDQGRIHSTVAFGIHNGRIATIHMMRNPDKLHHLN